MSALRRALGIALGLLIASMFGVQPAGAGFTTFETGEVRPLAMSPDGTKLFVANTPDGRLEIFSIGAGGLTHTGSVPVGLEPCAVAARTNSEVWVVNHLSDSVSIVNVASSPPRIVRTLLVGDEPRDIVFAGAAGNRAFITTAHRGQQRTDASIAAVSGAGDPQFTTPGIGRADVWVFDATALGATLGGTPIGIVTLFGDTPRALAVSSDRSTVYAAVFMSGNRTTTVSEGAVCDTDSAHLNNNTVQGSCTIQGVTMPGGLPLPHRNFAGDVRPEVGLVVRHNGTHWVDTLGRNWDPAIKFSLPDSDVFAIDADGNPPAESAAFSGVGTILFNMAVNPATGKLYVSNGEARNEVRFEGPGDFGGSTVQGHLAEYRISILDGSSVVPRHLNKHIDYDDRPASASTKNRSLATPLDMAVTSNGQTLYVAAFGSSKIGIFNTTQLENDTFTPNSADHIVVSGGGPSGLVLDEARGRLYVLTRFDNHISVIDTALRSEIAHLPLYNPEPLSVVDGRRFLYDAQFTSSNGEASCSSCHIFGDFDNLAWDLGNPDDAKIPNPLPKKLQQVAQIGGTNVDFDFFHPMKGPMATQTLRGMANHGAMHWRGDRADQNGDIFNEDIAFRNFRVAFPGLIGRDGPIPEADMQKFSDFILQVQLPPNPVRRLDNSLTAEQQVGRNFMTGSRRADGIFTGNGFGFNCVGCHTLSPAQGFFGADGQASFENETQVMKIAHLRNLYQKVGMFGMTGVSFFNSGDNGFKGAQIRGFGFLHDGSVDTVFRFLQATVFNDGGTFNPVGFQNDSQRRAVEQFLLAFDNDIAPIVGQQITLSNTNSVVVGDRITLLLQRAAAGECEVIVKGTVGGVQRGWYLAAGGATFRSDRAGEPLLNDLSLRVLANTAGQELTYTAVPLGNGQRAGIDRDEDGFFDRTEIDAGSDPADPNSTPANLTPTASASATATSTRTASATNTMTATSTRTPTQTQTPTFTVPPASTATNTATVTSTRTASGTASTTATATPTPSASPTPTETSLTPPSTPTPTPTTTPAPLCGSTPRGTCVGAGRSGLIIKNRGGKGNGLTWKWLKGAVSIPELGDPRSDTRYALCIYDDSGQGPSLAFSMAVPPGGSCGVLPCWNPLGGSNLRGFRFGDPTGQNDGARKMLLKGGRPGRDKLRIKGSGVTLPLPPAVSANEYFAQQGDVTVQLVTDAGGCWESSFPIGSVSVNSPRLYKASR